MTGLDEKSVRIRKTFVYCFCLDAVYDGVCVCVRPCESIHVCVPIFIRVYLFVLSSVSHLCRYFRPEFVSLCVCSEFDSDLCVFVFALV